MRAKHIKLLCSICNDDNNNNMLFRVDATLVNIFSSVFNAIAHAESRDGSGSLELLDHCHGLGKPSG